MKKKIIVVADDFGFSEAFNYGVIKSYKEGIVSSLNLIVNLPAAQHAVQLVREQCPNAELALHINYVQGKPISAPADIPTLVNENGEFYRSRYWHDEVHSNKCIGDLNPSVEDLYRECIAQIEYFKELTGRYPVTFDAHSVATNNVSEAFQRAAQDKHIHCPFYSNGQNEVHEHHFIDKNGENILMRGSRPEDWINDTSGLLDSPYLVNVLHFHPGYIDKFILDNSSLTVPRCYDLDTLCNPVLRSWLKEHDIEVITFNEALNAD